MNDFEKAKECLSIILEKGDLYDTIAVRENVKALKHSFVRTHAFLFSRILYAGIRVIEKVKSYFSPVEEVRKAQNKLREIIGAPVDFIRTKHQFDLYTDFNIIGEEKASVNQRWEQTKNPTLSIFYENSNGKAIEYVDHLKKILTFCELHSLDEIMLRENDLLNSFPDLNLENYTHTTIKQVLDCESLQLPDSKNRKEDKGIYHFNALYNSYILILNRQELRILINQLEVIKINKKMVSNLGDSIEDIPVRRAISSFLLRGDLEKLKAIVNSRLTLILNSDSTYKDRIHGKVFRSVVIKEDYVKVVSMNQKGEMINNTVTTLYDYLEVLDYKVLLKQLQMKDDNHEILALSALHLYLCQKMKVKLDSDKNYVSFYDYIYHSFLLKKSGKVKKIPGLYTMSEKRGKNFIHAFSSVILSFLLVAVCIITGLSFDFIQQVAFQKEDSDILNNIAETIFIPYVRSYEFEKNLVGSVLTFADKVKVDFSNLFSAFTGDVDRGNLGSNQVMATVNNLTGEKLPSYYATGYATDANYYSGQMVYSIEQAMITIDDFENVRSEFEVIVDIPKTGLYEWIKEDKVSFPKSFYPLDKGPILVDYVLTQIYIYDATGEYKRLSIDIDRLVGDIYYLTDYEISALNDMIQPKMVYVYGIGRGVNSFLEDIEKKNSYLESDSQIIKDAITKGLQLRENASDEEIYQAISHKKYSETPIKDSGLSWFIKGYDEVKYFEKIASMDSIVCNLAATLVAGTDEELVYTVGYLNYDDQYIMADEAHAWVMHPDGTLIDCTPASSEEKEEDKVFSKVLQWGLENKIPLYLLMAYLVHYMNKKIGKKVRVYFKVRKVSKQLQRPEMEESYIKLKDTLYGGLNVSINRTPIQLAETIEREFGGFTISELREIRSQLLQSIENQNGELTPSLDLLKNAQFLKTHSYKIKRMLKKNMTKKQK